MTPWAMAAWVVAGLALSAFHGLWLTPRLPEPSDGQSVGKLAYADLVTPRRVAALVVMTLTAQVATLAAPDPMRPLWLIYGSSVAALVWVDACTTWLPTKLTRLVGAQLLVAGMIAVWLGDNPAQISWHLGFGAAAAFVFWLAMWRLSRGGIGFGDVRLAPLTGVMAATMGLGGWFAALLAGSLLGVIWGLTIGLLHRAPGTTGGFAYGPSLWAGPYLALVYTMLSGG